jgi:hypothetical protein
MGGLPSAEFEETKVFGAAKENMPREIETKKRNMTWIFTRDKAHSLRALTLQNCTTLDLL